MTISRYRAAAATPAIAIVALAAPLCAQAQSASDRLLECAQIDDPAARLACYDSQMRTDDGSAAPSPGPVAQERAPGSAVQTQAPPPPPVQTGPTTPASAASDFGLPEPRERVERKSQEITATVAQVRPRQPGIYLVTLEDGAQWLFTESVRRTYRVPRRGDSITIESAALGSFLMRFDKQAAVRVERIR